MARDEGFPWVPVGLGVAAGIGIGVVLGRTLFVPRTLPSGAIGKVQPLPPGQEWKLGKTVEDVERRHSTSPWTLAPAPQPKQPYEEQESLARLAAPYPISPYALVEWLQRRRVDWNKVENATAKVEAFLGQKMSALLDPRSSRILFPGAGGFSQSWGGVPGLRGVDTLAVTIAGARSAEAWLRSRGIACSEWRQMRVDERFRALSASLGTGFDPSLWFALDALCDEHRGWSPEDLIWAPSPEAFPAEPNVLDPVQGCIGDCWLISQFSGMAWTRPDLIRARSYRGTTEPLSRESVTFEFYDNDAHAPAITTTDTLVPYRAGSDVMFGAHSPGGRTGWPSLWEKAVAVREDRSDRPDLPAFLDGTSPRSAHWRDADSTGLRSYRSSYTGRPITWFATRSRDDAVRAVRSFSPRGRAAVTATCGTFALDDDRGSEFSFRSIEQRYGYSGMPWGLQPSHQYTILGYIERGPRFYVVLRNPWGMNVPGGEPYAIDSGVWEGLVFGNSGDGTGGVAAVEAEFISAFFSGIIVTG